MITSTASSQPPTTTKSVTIKPTTSELRTTKILSKSAPTPVLTVDVRQAASEQQKLATIKSVQRQKAPAQVALIAIDTSSGTPNTTTKYSSIDTVIQKDTSISSSNPDVVYLNDRQYVDEAKIRNTWLEWTNNLRTELGRTPYTTDRRLNMTAKHRSE